jgi:hypothetical protein
MLVASMVEHKFKIGEIVNFYPKPPNDAPWGACQIIRRLPAAEGEFQYVIRSVYEDDQRVAKENEPYDLFSSSLAGRSEDAPLPTALDL